MIEVFIRFVNRAVGIYYHFSLLMESLFQLLFNWSKCGGAELSITHNGDDICINNSNVGKISCSDLLRYVARLKKNNKVYPLCPLQRTEVDSWLYLSEQILVLPRDEAFIEHLNASVASLTYLCTRKLTIADIGLLNALLYNGVDIPKYVHLHRWSKLIALELNCDIAVLLRSVSGASDIGSPKKKAKQDVAKFVELPGAREGEVVVRFPPEASGYLHIGHAKAALVNQYYQQTFKGKLILRFDDTNPAKENEHFENVIREDLEMLQVKYDVETRTSSYFEEMIELCSKMIKDGNAYADDTDGEVMKKEREMRSESKNRSNTVQKNWSMWEEMLKGTDYGQQCCIRAKIDMNSDNGAMRDPTLYRCKNETHVSTGDKFKAYPTYDFACPIVDSLEGVTHALRTTEYHDRDEQYYWLLEKMGLRKPYIWEYARLNLQNTVLSKRRLTWLVSEGVVDSWEDPRFPTVRGILRRGMTVQGLKDFIAAQGGSRSVVQMEWDKIWAFNKKVIDPIAPRYTALTEKNLVPLVLSGIDRDEIKNQPAHPKNADVGTKEVAYSKSILIEQQDAMLLKENESVTLINWGNCVIETIKKTNSGDKVESMTARLNLSDTNFKATKCKLTWLPQKHSTVANIPVISRTYSHIISKPVLGKDEDFKQFVNRDSLSEETLIGDHNLAEVAKGSIIQIQRKGFHICDRAYTPFDASIGSDLPAIFIYIPDGHKSAEEQEKQQSLTSGKAAKTQGSGKKSDENSGKKTAEDTRSSSVTAAFDKHAVKKVSDDIVSCGDGVRQMKLDKKPAGEVKVEVDKLLALKAKFKELTGSAYSPEVAKKLVAGDSTANASGDVTCLDEQIISQGNKVRQMKSDKKPADEVKVEVDVLLALKAKFKEVTGVAYSPEAVKKFLSQCVGKSAGGNPEGSKDLGSDNAKVLDEKIVSQGNKVRQMKSEGASKEAIGAEVETLKSLKSEYKRLTGNDWAPAAAKNSKPNSNADSNKCKNSKKDKHGDKSESLEANTAPPAESDSQKKKETKLGLGITMEENYSEWYTQVITKAELIEYYDVSGCYVLRPLSYAIWETIQAFFDCEIKKLGVENCYFPMFVSKSALEREKDHIQDFAPEVAWVTKSGKSDLAEPIAIRPTSETVMYPSYARWIKSHRDLPLKLNQWNSVVRWEFKHPTPFLRTREFLWQEGHTAFAYKEEACQEVLDILNLYARVFEELLAIPVVKGRKTEKEKFAGADFTTTCEAFLSQSGRAIQGATSHHLGQNFSKMFGISIENPDVPGDKVHVYQNSWGLSTRTIGAMVMAHSDNKGLVLPPRVAQIQVIVVPCGVSEQADNEKELFDACSAFRDELVAAGIKCRADLRPNYSPGWKFNHWELKGIPIRAEIGPKDLSNKQVMFVRRDNGFKKSYKRANIAEETKELLEQIQSNLYNMGKQQLTSHLRKVYSFDNFCALLDQKNILLAPFCGDKDCEGTIKEESAKGRDVDAGAPSMGAKSLCSPFEQPDEDLSKLKCINPACTKAPIKFTLFGRSY